MAWEGRGGGGARGEWLQQGDRRVGGCRSAAASRVIEERVIVTMGVDCKDGGREGFAGVVGNGLEMVSSFRRDASARPVSWT